MHSAARTALISALAFFILADPGRPSHAAEMATPLRDRASIRCSGAWTSVRLVDETDSPVRWRGDGPGWRLTADIPVRAARLQATMRRDRMPVTVDPQDGPAVDPVQYPRDSRFRERTFVSQEVSVSAQWRAAGGGEWRHDAGAFVRWRDEFITDAGFDGGGGVSGVSCGPRLRSTWRAGWRWEFAADVAFPICGWYVRNPYLPYAHDYDWHRDIRFAALPECGQVDLEVVVRRALGSRVSVEAAGCLDHGWTDRNRHWREFAAQARLTLVLGL